MTGKLLNGIFWLCGGLLICFSNSCNDFDSFGSDLLNNNWINAKGIDTFKIFASAAPQDSAITYYNGTYLSSALLSGVSFPLGKMVDPLFGKASAGIGTQLRFISTSNFEFLHNPVDSIVLSLRYDTSLFYGKYSEAMDFGVYPLKDAYNTANTYYSNNTLNYDATMKLGGLTKYSPSKDSLHYNDSVNFYAQLRIPLDTAVFMNLLRAYDDTVYYVVDSFNNIFKGIAILCESGNGMLSVQPHNSDSKISIYFHIADSTTAHAPQEFNMGSLAAKTPFYQMDNSNTISETCINGSLIPSDSLLCLQGFNGRDIRLTIPYDSAWNGKFINFAVLQFYVAEPVLPSYDISNFSLPGLLEIFDYSSGTKVGIDDVAMGLTSNYSRVFGGNPIEKDVNGKAMYSYKMNITRHFQKSLRAKKAMDLVISPLLKLESPARLVFFGPSNSQFPAKLRLTYSE